MGYAPVKIGAVSMVRQKVGLVPVMALLRRVGQRAFQLSTRARFRVPEDRELLFAFEGGSGARPNMGCELYATHRVFRESIDATAAVVESTLGYPVGGSFRNRHATIAAATPEEARRNDLVRLGLLQLAYVDAWREEGVVPDAVCAISLGEMVAPYAAGMLSRVDCARLIAVAAQAISRTRAPGVMFTLDADEVTARELCEEAPTKLLFLGTTRADAAVVLGGVSEAPLLREYLASYRLREIPSDWQYHTPGLDVDRPWMEAQLAGMQSLPSTCPYYSAVIGDRFPDGARLDAAFFAWMVSRPFYLGRAAKAALTDKPQTVITIGADPGRQIVAAAMRQAGGQRVQCLHSLPGEGEAQAWRRQSSEARSLTMRHARVIPVVRSFASLLESDFGGASAIETYARLRERGSVHPLPNLGSWLVLSYEGVRYALTHPALFSSHIPPLLAIDAVLLGADAPGHSVARRRLSRRFSTVAIEAHIARVRALASKSLSRLQEGEELDVIAQFTAPLVELVGGLVLGLEPSEVRVLGVHMRRAYASGTDLYTALTEPLAALAPHSPVFAELTQGEQSNAYTEDQARSVIRLLWVAGADALNRFLPMAVLLLLERDDLRAQLLADPGLLSAFIDEALRLHPPEQALVRVTTADVVVDGVTIPAGAVVRLTIAAANRDPERFEQPDRVRLDRGSAAHLSFGGGPHRCLGAALAHATAVAALGVLLEQVPYFKLRQPLTTLRYAGVRAVRQLEQLIIGR